MEHFGYPEENARIFANIDFSLLGLSQMSSKYFPHINFIDGSNLDKLNQNEKVEIKKERMYLRPVDIIEDILTNDLSDTTYIVVTHRMHVRNIRNVVRMQFPLQNLRKHSQEILDKWPDDWVDIEYCSVVAFENDGKMIYDNYSKHIN